MSGEPEEGRGAAAVRQGRTPRDAARGGLYGVLLRDSVIYGTGRMLNKFLHALLLPLYTAYLDATDYGILGTVLITAALIDVVVTLGFDVAFSRFYFDDRGTTHHDRVITNVFFIDSVYPAVLLGGLALAMPSLSRSLMGSDGYANYFYLALVNIFFTNWADLAFQLFRLEHRPWIFTAYNIGRIFVQIPLTVALVVWADMGVLGVLVGTAVSGFVVWLTSLPTYMKRVTFRIDPALLRSMFAFAIPAVFTGLIFFILKLSNRYFLLWFDGLDAVGLYTVAFTLSQPIYLAMTAFRMAWPQWHYARLHEPERHRRLVARSSTYFLLVCLGMLVLQGTFMPLVIRVLTRKPEFWVVGPTTLLLVLATVAYSAYFVFWSGANIAKKNRLIPLISLAACAVNVAINVAFIPSFGVVAAGASALAGYVVLAILMYPISQRYYPIPFEWRRFGKMTAAAAAALLAAWGVQELLGERTDMPFIELLWREAVKAPTLLLLPLTLWLSGFFTAGERAAVDRLWRHGLRFVTPARRRTTDVHTTDAGAVGASLAIGGASALSIADAEAAEDDELQLEVQAHLDINEPE